MVMSEVVAAIKELVLPELKEIRAEQSEIKTALGLISKRLDDVNLHLTDQSRRIDVVREELTKRIDAVREELTKRIDVVREELTGRVDRVNDRLDRLYDVVVRRDEHEELRTRVYRLEVEVAELKQRLAA